MKCQDGAREIAYITYPQGALVVFLRSDTGGKYSRSVETKREVVLQHSHFFPLSFSSSLAVFGVSVEKIATAASKGHGHVEI